MSNMDWNFEGIFPTPVKSMPQRIEAVLRAKGDPTQYQFGGVPNKVGNLCISLKKGKYGVW